MRLFSAGGCGGFSRGDVFCSEMILICAAVLDIYCNVTYNRMSERSVSITGVIICSYYTVVFNDDLGLHNEQSEQVVNLSQMDL